jgi:5'-3' exonuclease
MITPGTEFMKAVDAHIQGWIANNQLNLSFPTKVIYSSHMIPGEGEHKIMDMIREGKVDGDGAHVIYGLDDDLILLSMMAPIDNIYLMREDLGDVIHIDNLKRGVKEEYRNSPSAIDDFVVMSYLIGNDFLPHMPSHGDIGEALDASVRAYKRSGLPIVVNGDVDFPGLASFLTELAREEPSLLKGEAIKEIQYPSPYLQAALTKNVVIGQPTIYNVQTRVETSATFNYDLFREYWYKQALSPKGQPGTIRSITKLLGEDYFNDLVSGDNIIDSITDMCIDYLIGIAWIFRYYNKGMDAVNFKYVYRHHYTPLIGDIAVVASGSEPEDFVGYKEVMYEYISPIHQLLAVLPPQSKSILPKEVQKLMNVNSVIADYYPTYALLDRYGTNKDWQGVLLINFVNIDRIVDAVNKYAKISKRRYKEYDIANVITVERTQEEAAQIVKQRRSGRGRGGGRGRGRGRGRGSRSRSGSRSRTSGGRGRSSYGGRGRSSYGGRGGRGDRGDRTSAGRSSYGRGGRTSGDRGDRRPTERFAPRGSKPGTSRERQGLYPRGRKTVLPPAKPSTSLPKPKPVSKSIVKTGPRRTVRSRPTKTAAKTVKTVKTVKTAKTSRPSKPVAGGIIDIGAFE